MRKLKGLAAIALLLGIPIKMPTCQFQALWKSIFPTGLPKAKTYQVEKYNLELSFPRAYKLDIVILQIVLHSI